ncbi:MAG: acireductone synthase [Cyanobacteria bacterium]|nr:acireductone synthase [Cyanobacteriota bacterium]
MVSCILLDIEGTTCPVSFVAAVLFPYARDHLSSFLEQHNNDPAVQALIKTVQTVFSADSNPEVELLRQSQAGLNQIPPSSPGASATTTPSQLDVVPYLHWLIDHDIKLTALKDLQGLIWMEGYACGDLVAPLFNEVAEALLDWKQKGYQLAVYSSGSVAAQQLLYRHSQDGNLEGLFSHWFDTRRGPKQSPGSYSAIASILQLDPEQILFVSDAVAELVAASEAGMAVFFSDREGNPERDPGGFTSISSLAEIQLEPPNS